MAGEFFVDATPGLVDRGAKQILKHFLIFAFEDFGFDAHFGELLLAVHLHDDHAAAGRGFDVHGFDLLLQALLHLPELRQHLL